MSSECRRLDLQSSALAQSITGMMGFRLGMHRKTANTDGVRITTATGQRVRLDEVSVHRGDQTEADRESGIADHQDDPLVTRPLHVHVVNTDDKVTDTNTCQLPMSHAHNQWLRLAQFLRYSGLLAKNREFITYATCIRCLHVE